MTPDVYPGYAQAMVANCLIPAYYCFAGYDGLNEYVMDTMAANGTILFFHFEPDIFHFDNVGKFARVAFPPTDPERVALSRGVFGVWGYGMPTQNPVDVDFPDATLMKTFPAFLDDDEHLHQLLTRFQITARRMTTLLGNYSVHRRNKAVTNPVFTTACQWVQTNFRTWSAWIDTLPLCTIHLHMNYTIAEVNNGTARRVTFQWIRPDPDNASLPYVCEGGMLELPRPLFSSKSAKWLKNNFAQWNDWLATPPPCDRSHYSYSIHACDQESRRQVSFFWVVPGDGESRECLGGISLPPMTSVSCDYVPTSSSVDSAFQGITILSCIIFSLLLICGIVIVVFREKAVVKRSQWPLLVLIVIGGMILCVDIILGAYQSTDMICGSLLILDSLSFSMIFVAILVKCLRVYLVFNNKAMKKITVSLWKMLKLYSLIVTIDIGIVVVGLLVDYPNATIFTTPATEFDGDVDHVTCKSTGLVFSALSLFWKILIVGTGLYFAFLIRHADSDFQETKWIVASAVVMVVGGIVMIPLMYMTMSTALSFTLRSLVLLFGMADGFVQVLVIAFMVMPKLWRLGKIKSTSAKTPAVKNSEQLSSDAIHVEDKTTGKIGRSQMCPDTTPGMKCRNGCSKNTHCITAEGQGKPCLLVGMMTPAQDPGYFEALLTNSKIPAMFCFAGYAGLNQYVVDTMRQNKSIVFYHFEPDVFHTDKKGLFTRITFPRANSTATTSNVNLVSTDFPASPLMKYYSDTMVHNPTLLNFLTNFALTPLDMTNLLASYDTLQNDPTVADPLFATACRWVQQNSRTWRGWIERLPLCTLEKHLKVTITDSFDNMTTPVNTSQIDFRTISFAWFNPNPDNATEPYLCDGGIITVPPPLKTSRSVEWLMENADEWPLWMHTKPPCQRLHYNYTIGPCTPDSTRPVTFFWRLPGRVNGSTECTGGIALPGNLVVECDYIPVASPVYESITMLTCIVIMFLVVCGILVVAFRKRSVVKRAQWPLLLLIVVGGILMCVYIILTGGEPTDVLCAARPILASLAFSVTFTAIFVKSLRVYLLFLAGENRKKIKVTLWKMIKLYLVIVVIDTGVVVIGLLADFPHPAISIAAAKTFDGTVDHYTCHSSTFIFKAMTIFFKTLVLIAGSYVAFLIRNADADFQESMWILASSVVVVVGAMILTPVAYFMDLDASSIFAIVSGVVLFCTVRCCVMTDIIH
ncbi:hypothetical protein DYB32_001468 [Aphanomyces invadans]|uniref:G-protein coupled receptors family 3 profile domain-containing protein n=1 Tax=Aphanomyces invadans TaxID=157072 RepID=A0A418B673_9STRA|nr:hypothetical protein DYB32_001468 [Aphanomyces invadans]